ncbi:MAG TPA: DUF4397 domain-containing protein [Chitinophagaceae bacterium]|nr:DUF4397 domain-containing protein [Chitinophagaceae bacterium]
MKKILFGLLITGMIAGCGKENIYSNDFSSAVFINASPGSPSVTVFIDTIPQVAAAIAYRSNSGYRSVQPGARNLEFRTTTNFVTTKRGGGPTENFVANTASSYFLYDTLTVSNQNFRVLKLSDDLTVPAKGSAMVRFVPLAIKAPAVDVTFLRTSNTPNDSVTFTNRAYVGDAPSADALKALSLFTPIPIGTYTVKLKTAGTQNVLASSTSNVLTGTTGLTGIFTFYSAGTAQGQPLAISSFRHYP